MATDYRGYWLCGIVLAGAVFVGATRSSAADPNGSSSSPATPPATASSGAIDMFDAMHDGDLGVQFIPHNSREATLILTNNTDQPLNVHLPDAFAAVPALAQFQQQQPGGRGPQNQSFGVKGKPNQALGSGTNPNQRPNGFGGAVANGKAGAQAGNGVNAGAFSIPPERVVKLKLPAVCLEYGNAEPNAHVAYTIVPIETYTSSAEVRELCRQLGTGKLDQQVAQAAAWHLTSHMSWDKITEMKHFPHNSGFSHAVFSKDQIRAAQELTDKVIKIVEAQPAATPPTEQKPAASNPAATSIPLVVPLLPAPKAVGVN